MILTEPIVRPLWFTPEPENLIEVFSRICYNSEDKITEDSHKAFCRKLIDRQHEDCLECAAAIFYIKCDRATQNQLVRHRHMTFQVRSQRYVNESDFDWFVPHERYADDVVEIINSVGPHPMELQMMIHRTQEHYNSLIQAGWKKEDARFILPNCVATEMNVHANLRSWRHFIVERGAKAAQYPIRQIAVKVYKELSWIAPNVFHDFELDEEQMTVTKGKR